MLDSAEDRSRSRRRVETRSNSCDWLCQESVLWCIRVCFVIVLICLCVFGFRLSFFVLGMCCVFRVCLCFVPLSCCLFLCVCFSCFGKGGGDLLIVGLVVLCVFELFSLGLRDFIDSSTRAPHAVHQNRLVIIAHRPHTLF